MEEKQYNQAYFDKWYRDPAYAVNDADEVARKVHLAIALAEYYLGRPVMQVLDIGCGEGNWRHPLLTARPEASYVGIDASDYVVTKYGACRHILQATFADLAFLRFETPFDLIICSNVLHYLSGDEIQTGIQGLDELLGGVAFIEVYTDDDAVEGDDENYIPRPATWYRQCFQQAGLHAIGSHAYVGSSMSSSLLALEHA